MEEAKSSAVPHMINRPRAQVIRPALPFYFDLTMLPSIIRPHERELVMKNTEYDPNRFNPDGKTLIRDVAITLAVKSVLFAIPPLVIGIIYWSQCQVQEWIPHFLMVLGIEMIVENILLVVSFLIVMVVLRKRSEGDRNKKMEFVKTIWLGVGTICTLAWYIAGSVWVFSVKNQVQFDDVENPNYCHRGLYWYAFVMCILWYLYLFIAILCIPYIWKCQKWQIETEKTFNPVYFTVKY